MGLTSTVRHSGAVVAEAIPRREEKKNRGEEIVGDDGAKPTDELERDETIDEQLRSRSRKSRREVSLNVTARRRGRLTCSRGTGMAGGDQNCGKMYKPPRGPSPPPPKRISRSDVGPTSAVVKVGAAVVLGPPYVVFSRRRHPGYSTALPRNPVDEDEKPRGLQRVAFIEDVLEEEDEEAAVGKSIPKE